MALTDQQVRFATEYVVDYNGTQAAIRAGYSRDNAASEACRLRLLPEVQAIIREHRREETAERAADRKRLLEEQRRLAFADPRELVNEDGTFRRLHELDADIAQAIEEVTVDEEVDSDGVVHRRTRYKLASKSKAATLLAKLHGLVVDRNEHSGPNGTPLGVIVVPSNGRGPRVGG